MSALRDRIIALVGQRVPQHLIAEACNVTPSYISQLLSEPAVQEEIAILRADSLEEDLAMDGSIDKNERQALKLLEAKMPFAKAGELAGIFKVLNSARRRAVNPDAVDVGGGAKQVTIVLPANAQMMLQINSESQVTEINGRTLAPLPSRSLPALAEEVRKKKEQHEALPYVQEVREKAKVADQERASDLLVASRDVTALINGVHVVI